MTRFEVSAPAKINLFLHVGEKRIDGFHELETLFQTISLTDTLRFTESDEPRLTCDNSDIPTDARNLVSKAVVALRAEASFPPLAIHIVKRIPAGGGLGGGSSDAAATLVALRDHFSLPVSDARLREIAASLGSDVPFFIHGGTAYARGRGEQLFEIGDGATLPILLVMPGLHVSTPHAYGELARMRSGSSYPHGPQIGAEVARKTFVSPASSFVKYFRNDLEDPVFAMYPQLAQWKGRLYHLGADFALMSGSGSTIFGVFASEAARDAAMAQLQADVRVVKASTLVRS